MKSDPKAVDQSLARSFEELSDRLNTGDAIRVSDDARRETRGVLSALSPTSLVLLIDGTTRELSQDSVTQIDRRGARLRNGVLIGMTVGAVTPAVIIFSLCQKGCHGSDLAAATTWSLGWGLIGGGIGAAAGAGIDAMRAGWTTVYRAPATSKPARLTVMPEALAGRRSVRVLVRF